MGSSMQVEIFTKENMLALMVRRRCEFIWGRVIRRVAYYMVGGHCKLSDEVLNRSFKVDIHADACVLYFGEV